MPVESRDDVLFDCSHCNAICCINPPQLHDLKEVKKAIELGAKVLITPSTQGEGYHALIDKEVEVSGCPFWKNSSCSIYEDRFLVCREYLCSSYKTITNKELKSSSTSGLLRRVTTPRPNNTHTFPTLLSFTDLEGLPVELVNDFKKLQKRVAVIDLTLLNKYLTQLKETP